jgi:HlyD family secretion protein
MKLRFFVIIILCIFSLIGVVGFIAIDHLAKTSPSFSRKINGPIPVQVVQAKKNTLTEIIGATGEVRPISLVNLTFKVPARVEKVTVDIGDTVAQGQVLLEFDRELQAAALGTAKSSLAYAASELKRARKNFQRFKTIYQQGLSKATLESAQSALAHAAGEVERSRQHVQRIKAIYEQKLLPKAELEKAESALEAAKARYQEAREKLLRTQRDLRAEVDKAEATLEAAKVLHQEAREKLVQARKELQNTSVVSPVSGVIMERLINPGEISQSAQPLLTIGRIDQVLVEAKIAEERVADIYPQQSAAVTFNAFPNEVLEGEIIKIKPVTDAETKTFLVYVKLANREGKLTPGLTGFIRIKKPHETLTVPSIALISPTGLQESTVFVVDNGAFAKIRKVKVGVVAEGMTEIVGGLAEGEQVVVVGQMALRDGDQVRIGDEFKELKTQFAQERPHP